MCLIGINWLCSLIIGYLIFNGKTSTVLFLILAIPLCLTYSRNFNLFVIAKVCNSWDVVYKVQIKSYMYLQVLKIAYMLEQLYYYLMNSQNMFV